MTVIYERDGVRYYSSRYDHAMVEANIRKAFCEKRTFHTKEELIPEEASLLNIANFTPTVHTEKPDDDIPHPHTSKIQGSYCLDHLRPSVQQEAGTAVILFYKEIAMLQKKIDTMQKRQTELTKLFKRLYEDSVLGRIPDEQYRILSQEYTTEQKEIQEQLPSMEARLQELKDSSSNIARFIENAKRYSEIPELTSEILRIFIKRVEVGERAEKYSRTAPQEVRIYYRDIGLVDELPQSMAEAVAEQVSVEVA